MTPPTTSDNPLLEAALTYANTYGLAVLPLHAPTAHGCSCGRQTCDNIGKHPRLPNGVHGASTDPTVIRSWWEQWPDANVGIATGVPSGIVVIDMDGQNGLNTVREKCGGNLPGPVVKTGKGWHLYCLLPDGVSLTNKARLF